MRGPLSLALAPNGDLITANGDAVNANAKFPSELVEFTPKGHFIAQRSVDTSAQGGAFGLAIDQASGDVYALTGSEAHSTGEKVVTEYDAHGEEIERFGEFEQGKATAASSDKVHESPFIGGLAVNGAGDAYVFDLNTSDNFYHRLMEFEPCATGHCYAGAGHDIGAGFQGETKFPTQPAVDAAGHVYTLSEEKYVQEFDPGQSVKTPICVFEFAKGGMYSTAVKPNGGVFFFSYKRETGFQTKLVHELAPCQNGTFKEVGKFEVRPERDDVKAMAFDPLRVFPGREAGMLYGGAPGPVPGPGTGSSVRSYVRFSAGPKAWRRTARMVGSLGVGWLRQSASDLNHA